MWVSTISIVVLLGYRSPPLLRLAWQDRAKPEASDGKELGHEAQAVGLGI